MIDIDKWLDKEYDLQSYNCGHFVQDVYFELTGINLSELRKAFADSNFRWCYEQLKCRQRLNTPITPCLAVIQTKHSIPHVGVYIDNKILHLREQGVIYENVENFHNYKLNYYI